MKSKKTANTVTGIAAAALVATTAAYMMNAKSSKGKSMRKTATKAAKAMGQMVSDVVDNVTSSMLG